MQAPVKAWQERANRDARPNRSSWRSCGGATSDCGGTGARRAGAGDHGKSARALGNALRERGLRAEVEAVIDEHLPEPVKPFQLVYYGVIHTDPAVAIGVPDGHAEYWTAHGWCTVVGMVGPDVDEVQRVTISSQPGSCTETLAALRGWIYLSSSGARRYSRRGSVTSVTSFSSTCSPPEYCW